MPLLPEQRWLLALSAILTERNQLDHELLGGSRRPIGARKAVYALARWWDVYTPSDVERTLHWLFDEGHRNDYATEAKTSPESLLGWDLGRCASVAGWGFGAYLLDRDIAWGWLRRLVPRVRAAFGSFAELYASYLRGLAAWTGGKDETYAKGVAAFEAMQARPDSPLHVAWDADAEHAPPPTEALNVIEIAEGASIAEAIERAGSGGRVVLGPGTYRESVRVPFALELVVAGDGTATLEPPDGHHALAVHVPRSVLARGLVLRSTPGVDGKTCNAVHVGEAFVRLERCDVQGAHHGIGLVKDGDLHLFDSRVHDCAQSGVHIEDGCAVVVGSRIEQVGLHGIWRVKGGRSAVIEDVDIVNVGGTGAWMGGTTSVRKLRMRGAKTCALIAEGELYATACQLEGGAAVVNVNASAVLTMTDCTLRGGTSAGLQAQGGVTRVARTAIEANAQFGVVAVSAAARVELQEVRLRENATANIYCVDGAHVAADRCELEGSRVGAWARGGSMWLARSMLRDATSSGVQAGGPGRCVLVDCTIRGSRGGGAALEPAAAPMRLSRCTVESCAGPGIDLSPGTRIVLEDSVSRDHAAPDAVTDATITRADGGSMSAHTLVIERPGELHVALAPSPAIALFLDARLEPVPVARAARALVFAIERSLEGESGCDYRVDDDSTFVVSADDPAALGRARDAVIAALGDGRTLRELIDVAEYAEQFEAAPSLPATAASEDTDYDIDTPDN